MRYAVDMIRSVAYAGPEKAKVVEDPLILSMTVVAVMFVAFVAAGTALFVRSERNR